MTNLYIVLLIILVLYLIVTSDEKKIKKNIKKLFNGSNQEIKEKSIEKRKRKIKKEFSFYEKIKIFNYRITQYIFDNLIAHIILFLLGLGILFASTFDLFTIFLSFFKTERETDTSSWFTDIILIIFGVFWVYIFGLLLIDRVKQEKIENQKKKRKYLKLKFKYLIKTTCDKTRKKIIDISIDKPIKKQGKWVVSSVTLDMDANPNYQEVYVITDLKLNKLIG